jgi:hypothetical protein
LSLDNAIPDGLRKQFSNFLAAQGNWFAVGVQLIQLGTEIKSMNSWIITFQNKEMPFAQENVVFRDDLSFQRGRGDAEFFSRATDDGPCLQENNPILRRDVIGMDRDIVTGNLSFEDTHFSDILSIIALIFGEFRSDLELGRPLFFVSDSFVLRILPVLPEGCIPSLIYPQSQLTALHPFEDLGAFLWSPRGRSHEAAD